MSPPDTRGAPLADETTMVCALMLCRLAEASARRNRTGSSPGSTCRCTPKVGSACGGRAASVSRSSISQPRIRRCLAKGRTAIALCSRLRARTRLPHNLAQAAPASRCGRHRKSSSASWIVASRRAERSLEEDLVIASGCEAISCSAETSGRAKRPHPAPFGDFGGRESDFGLGLPMVIR